MIARPKMSRNEWNVTEIGASKVGTFAPFCSQVWLQIFGGTGEPSWKNGSVVGAKVHTATKLPTVPLDPTQAKYRVEADAPASPASHGSPGEDAEDDGDLCYIQLHGDDPIERELMEIDACIDDSA